MRRVSRKLFPMYFALTLNSIQAAYSGRNAPLLFEFTFRNTSNRHARLLNHELELWLDPIGNGSGNMEFMGALRPALHSTIGSSYMLIAQFQPQQQETMRFLWHHSPASLQRIEAIRKGGPVHLELRGELLVAVQGNATERCEWETFLTPTGQWPYRLSILHLEWADLLNRIEFKHLVIEAIDWPAFPTAWARADSSLKDAWEHHRRGNYEETMLSCRRAFECLGISIVGDPKANREAVLAQLFPNMPPEKRKRVQELWAAIQNLLNIAVHNAAQPMNWNVHDSEMTLLCTHSLLAYLAGS